MSRMTRLSYTFLESTINSPVHNANLRSHLFYTTTVLSSKLQSLVVMPTIVEEIKGSVDSGTNSLDICLYN